VVPGAGVRGWGVRGGRVWSWAGWPLVVVLVVQAVLSLRLVGADTAFQDEAAYLWAGHLEWADWLHGGGVPPFQAYFSGAPVIYPPVGALADSVGGLAGARVLSLVFMLGATALLWGTAGRLFGRRAAFFAAALFAVLGPTLHLGSFATYDALSVLLVAVAAWCVVRAGARVDATGWMVAAAVALAVANAAAYSSALFDPVVIAVAVLVAFPRPGGRAAVVRGVTLLTVLAALLLAGTLIGGSSYIGGIERTTLARVSGSDSVMTVLGHSWGWTGLVFVVAWCGVAASWGLRQPASRTWLLVVLAGAALLVPAEQAGLQTMASLNKHGDMGAWFAAIAAGYAVDRLIAAAPAGQMRALTCGACVVALALPAALGATQSRVFAANWPNSASFTAILRPLADQGSGHLLVEDPSIAEYYLPAGSQWRRWSSTRNIILPSGGSTGHPGRAAGVVGAGNPAVFARYIQAGYFSLVALNYADTTALDHAITADLRSNPHYHIVQVVPYGIEVPPIGQGTYVIWRYKQ
jgi:Dolichyl-phosphate-mannose-protein mannosyltransferase